MGSATSVDKIQVKINSDYDKIWLTLIYLVDYNKNNNDFFMPSLEWIFFWASYF